MILTIRLLMFILIINITFFIMFFNKFMGIAIFIFLLILISSKSVIENFSYSDTENSKINKILYDDTTQKIIENIIKKDECLNFKKFKYIIDNVINNISVVPMSKTIIKLFITDDEIKSIFNNFLKVYKIIPFEFNCNHCLMYSEIKKHFICKKCFELFNLF